MKSLTIAQQSALGLGVMILFLAVFGAFGYSSVQQMAGLNRAAGRADERLTELSIFLTALDEAEARKSALVITGKEELLEPYRETKDRVVRKTAILPSFYADDPEKRELVDKLAPLARERLDELDAALDARRLGGAVAASVEMEIRARQTMDKIRAAVEDLRKRERNERALRRAGIEETAVKLGRTAFAGVLVLMLLIGVTSWASMSALERRVGAAIQQVQRASAELHTSAEQQAKGAKDQVSAATEVSATMRELVITARMIAESAQRVTQVASETAAAARGGSQTVEDAQRTMEGVRQQVDQIVARMLELGKRSQEIGKILDIINELASQTNILAINATIEAAGAGAAGRRFGVVAGEIRKLADRVSGSTLEIRRLIGEIRSAADTTALATEHGAKAAEAGTMRFAEVTEIFRQIMDLVGGTARAAREIELSTKQQTSAMVQVSTAMSEVAQTARESEGGTTQTVNTAAELSTLSHELGRLIRRAAA
ncbi:methyl-accepting chemotaxis protein [Polyangium aurulentum]|uniref:methyl-accepting chemotaxis protein n=1 Tax=Polyangium aurulentum TaxID=2567896 RepID=UPI0010AE32C5|nr:methyl-accepting chemotaxis protein [Polyangium aurulentum]UQA60744.1 CHASE3 domain-containing protein [Polyangium aurulentum]